MKPLWQSLRAFLGDPVGKLFGSLSVLLTCIGFIRFAEESERGWMWLFFAAMALVALSFWGFHKQRKGQLDLAVFVGDIKVQQASHFTGDPRSPGWVCFLSRARIANRGDVRVALGPSISIQTGENAWLYADEAPGQALKLDLPKRQPQWLRTPVRVEPKDAVTGLIGFFLSPNLVGNTEEDLDPAIARLNDPGGKAEMTLVDYISGESITVTVPGDSRESVPQP